MSQTDQSKIKHFITKLLLSVECIKGILFFNQSQANLITGKSDFIRDKVAKGKT